MTKTLIFCSYLRAAIVFPFILVHFFLICLISLLFSLFKLPKRLTSILLQHFWIKILFMTLNIKIKLLGEDNLPSQSQSAIYLFNHSSVLDIPLLLSVTPHVYFAAKSSLFNIPIFGLAIRLYGALKIYRTQAKQTLNMYKQEASKRAKNGDSFALAPEGRRNLDRQNLLPFKVGPFLFSLFSQSPVVPVLIVKTSGTSLQSSTFYNWGSWKTTITISILKNYSPKSYSSEDIHSFKQKIQTLMQEEYTQCIQGGVRSI